MYIHLRLYFNSDLSLRNTYKVLSEFVPRRHVAIRVDWMQKYRPKRLFYNKIKISDFIVDETHKGWLSQLIWPWIAIDSENKELLQQPYQKSEICLLQRFLSSHKRT